MWTPSSTTSEAMQRPQPLVRNLLLDDLGGAAGQSGAAAYGADQGSVAVEVGVEMALPVVPELARIGLQRRNLDVSAFERHLRLAAVEAGRVVHVGEHRAGNAEVGKQRVDDEARRRDSEPAG